MKGASFHNDWMELLFSTEVLEKYKNVHGLYDMVEGRYDNELSDVTKWEMIKTTLQIWL